MNHVKISHQKEEYPFQIQNHMLAPFSRLKATFHIRHASEKTIRQASIPNEIYR
jgi:hypothetical protein